MENKNSRRMLTALAPGNGFRKKCERGRRESSGINLRQKGE
jgi:hypothetical protein